MRAEELLGRRRPPCECRRHPLPDLRTLWFVLVPRTRLEVAQFLVLHLVHLDVELDDMVVVVTMVDEDVVTDPVPAWSPDDLSVPPAEQLAGRLDVRPVLQLERDVVHSTLFAIHEVQRVVIRPATQEHEIVAHPIRYAETEVLDMEIRHGPRVCNGEGNVAELERGNALRLLRIGRRAYRIKQFDRCSARVDEMRDLGKLRRHVLSQFACNATIREVPARILQAPRRIDLERQPRQSRRFALLED